MTVVNPNAVLTYEDYLLLPEGTRYQLLEGELYSLTPAPTPYHQSILNRLQIPLYLHVEAQGLGRIYISPIDVVLSDLNVVQPDILFMADPSQAVVEELCIRGCPELVVEILSPSTSRLDKKLKFGLYDRFGAREYWIVDPQKKTLELYARKQEGLALHATFGESQTLVSPLFEGFALPLSRVF